MSKKEKDIIGKYRTASNWLSGSAAVGGISLSLLAPPLAPVLLPIAIPAVADVWIGNEIQETLLRKGKDAMTISKKEKTRRAVTANFHPATDKEKAVYYNPKGTIPA